MCTRPPGSGLSQCRGTCGLDAHVGGVVDGDDAAAALDWLCRLGAGSVLQTMPGCSMITSKVARLAMMDG